MLNEKQVEAVEYEGDELLVLAGAGSGKTRCVIEKVKRLVENGMPLSQIVAITFTNKAAKEMIERLSESYHIDRDSTNITTFHSFCFRLIKQELSILGWQRVRICNDNQTKDLLADACESVGKEASDKAMSEIERLKNRLIYPGNPALNKSWVRPIYEKYQELLESCFLFDFNDLISKTVLLLQSNEKVREKYQNKFKYIIVDEFQDVNNAQFELVKVLHKQGLNRLMVVGDDSQAIYGFRDSDPSFIIDFVNKYPQSKTVKLERNYRSSSHILSAANTVIDNNRNGLKKELWTERTSGEKISIVTLAGEKSEAKFVAEKIMQDKMRGLSYSDFAILYRVNSQSKEIQNALAEHGIPFKVVKGQSFFDRREVRDLFSYLCFIDNPFDALSFRRCVQVPKRKIGNVTISEIIKESNKHKIPITDVLISHKKQEVKDFGFMIRDLRTYDDNASYLISNLVDEIEFEKYLASLKGTVNFASRIESIEKIKEISDRWAKDRTLHSLLEHLTLVDTSNEEDNDEVILSTVHSAKGLEYDTVFLIGMNKGLFPHETLDKEVEEARRLFYVAITRAKRKLYISHTEFSGYNENLPSLFLSELPKEVVEHIGGCDDSTDQWQSQERQGYGSRLYY